ncbi:MAG: PIN domain-containing protein [Thiofilum sp.]|uniref:PIN domain-containing protein n=1 Tax=Thiofilum sp. TaxID=2212733 RepID=UPI0025F49776|nr:PIN domain-containing protein [Thiofilum sp.]MBK8451852.1 PIN domain-containing protein [Thiofilum sp.]
MPAKVFLDSNVLIYLYSEDEPEKAALAQQCAQEPDAWISTQVLNEVSNVLRRKQKQAYPDILSVIQELQGNFQVTTVTTQTIEQALLLGERYGYSYFDSLMVASALEQSCKVLYSEDMQHGQVVEGLLRIVDPFVALTSV